MNRRTLLSILLILLVVGWGVSTLVIGSQSDDSFITIQLVSWQAQVWLLLTIVLVLLILGFIMRLPSRQQMLYAVHHSLSQYMSDAVLICRSDGRIVWHNKSAQGYLSSNKLISPLREQLASVHQNQQMIFKTIPIDGQRYRVQTMPLQGNQLAVIVRPIAENNDRNALYDNFIRRIVHDMRNPLAGIIGHATNLSYAQDDSAAVQEAADVIEKEARRLARLVDSMLFDARLAYVPLNVEQLDLLDVVEEAVFSVEERIYQNTKTIDLAMSVGRLPFTGDRDLLLRAFENLLDNSVKYTGDDGQIHVSITIRDDIYVIEIRDNGMGIPADFLPDHIFQPLVRAQSGGEGSGLGLSIVQKIVNMHMGTIRATSPKQGGTTMTIQLPRMTEVRA